MNKGVGGGIGGAASGSGPTAAASAAAAQKQKALLQRVETDVSSLVDNFTFLVNVARVCLHPLLFALKLVNLSDGLWSMDALICSGSICSFKSHLWLRGRSCYESQLV